MELSLTENKQLLRIDVASELELEQLNISLNKRIESWRFNPLVKKGLWDGYVSYIKDDKWIPSGLWREVMGICKDYGFEFKLEGVTEMFDTNIGQEKFTQWALDFFDKSETTPRDYQIEAAYNILKFKRCLSELATSSGKTLISFLTVAYLLEKQKAQRILFIVPNVSLVVQASEDFLDYNYRNAADIKVQQIYSGQKIRPGRNVIIGTYQSLVKKDKAYFEEFDAVIVDETHKAKSASIKTILQKCVNADYKYGLSGTIPKEGTLDRLTLMAYTGPLITEISANYLQNEGHIAGCRVKIIKMDYAPQSTKDAFREMSQNRMKAKMFLNLNKIILSIRQVALTSLLALFPEYEAIVWSFSTALNMVRRYMKSFVEKVIKLSIMLTVELIQIFVKSIKKRWRPAKTLLLLHHTERSQLVFPSKKFTTFSLRNLLNRRS